MTSCKMMIKILWRNWKKFWNCTHQSMVGRMVQSLQSLYLFTFNALIIIHEYIYPNSTTKFTFKKYISSHLRRVSYSRIYLLTFTRCIHLHSTVYIHSHSRLKYWFNTMQYSFSIFCTSPTRIIWSQLPFQSQCNHILVPRGRDPFGQHWKSQPLARSNDIPVLNGFVNTIDWDQNQSDLSDLTQSMRRVTGSLW